MHILGIEIGTSAVKAVLFHFPATGGAASVASATVPVTLEVPAAGRAEQDPHATLGAVCAVMDEVRLKAQDRLGYAPRIRAVGFSTAMHSLLSLDAAGVPLHPAITWADQRAAHQAERLRAAGGARLGARRAGSRRATCGCRSWRIRWSGR